MFPGLDIAELADHEMTYEVACAVGCHCVYVQLIEIGVAVLVPVVCVERECRIVHTREVDGGRKKFCPFVVIIAGLVVDVAPAEHSGETVVMVLRAFGVLERGVHQPVPSVILLKSQRAFVIGDRSDLRAVGLAVAPGMLESIVRERLLERQRERTACEYVGTLVRVALSGTVGGTHLHIYESVVESRVECRSESVALALDVLICVVAMIIGVVGEDFQTVCHFTVERVSEPVGGGSVPRYGHL